MPKEKKMWDNVLTVIMSLLCLLWIYPIVLILQNSQKIEGTFTPSTVFKLPTAETFAGLSNYIYGVTKMGFLSSLGYSLVITVSSVALILLCCSMTGWYLTRVNNKLSKFMNLLIVFSMVVPFQMVMFTLSKTADTLNLNTPWNICIIYLGFGAGLAVFMFTGVVKSMPIAIEEAAMIDGCNPIQIFFKVVCPILKPTMISTAILETMWVWNDYLLPTLVLDIKTFRTIPMAIQYFRGSYGKVKQDTWLRAGTVRENIAYGTPDAPHAAVLAAGKDAFWGLLMPVIILGGIYGSVFTPTEAAAVSVFYGLIVGVFIYHEIDFKKMKDILVDSCSTTATVMFITLGATLFGYVLTRARLDLAIKDFMLNITGGSTVIFFIIVNIVLLIAGCFLDSTSALYIFTPLFAPVALQLGIDPIHLGTVMIVNLAIGLFTPPVGVNLYVACGIGDIKIEEITKGIIPCLLAELVVLLLITYIPSLSLMFVG